MRVYLQSFVSLNVMKSGFFLVVRLTIFRITFCVVAINETIFCRHLAVYTGTAGRFVLEIEMYATLINIFTRENSYCF